MEKYVGRILMMDLSDSDYSDASRGLDDFLNQDCEVLDESVGFEISKRGYGKYFVCSHSRIVNIGSGRENGCFVEEKVTMDGRGDISSYNVFLDVDVFDERVSNFFEGLKSGLRAFKEKKVSGEVAI